MSDRFLTLREAEEFTGKSRSTLRRFLDGIVKVENSPDRKYLQPSDDEVAKLKEQSQPFSWRIAEELLHREFAKDEPAPEPKANTTGESDRLISVLEKTVSMLEKELSEKNAQITHLHERQREHNYLLKDLQERLALTAPSMPKSEDVVEAASEPEEGSGASEEPSDKAQPKKSVFRRLFGS